MKGSLEGASGLRIFQLSIVFDCGSGFDSGDGGEGNAMGGEN